jgi:ferredoxin
MQYQITVAGTDIQFSCNEDQALLPAMIHGGRGPIKHGCCGGGCGVCKMRIVSGKWEVFKPMSTAHVSEDEKGRGIVLVCCVQPRSDLVIGRV